ncbi:MAG: electron transport complex subunit RsxA [Gammaproteobacteria bacterium]|jgi:electron transport complex protein RnfA|nr:electron transport complex subunit RsxA [Gammaproteobacteria bacterium]MDH4310818.1 electron transport complex subunit RsxA [Gammaproteobacteria bacterium]MDH5272111.1 electron transport complex subunit RsxA [Gammaproteobacteria bacterium]
MTELLLLALGASLVNNFVLSNFLGLCPFIGVSRRFEAAAGMALATLFVLTIASGLSFSLWQWVLVPLGLEYLRTLVFILLIAGIVQFTEIMVRATSPLLHQLLGIFLPLITTNCAVLGVALLNVDRQHGLLESLVFGAGAGAGFGLALLLFTTLRERLDTADVPQAFRGVPVALVTAGLMALAFMGFAGLGAR